MQRVRVPVRQSALGATYIVMSDTPTHVDLPEAVTSHPLHLTADPWWDTLHCLAFGTVSDGLTDVQRSPSRAVTSSTW